MSIMTRWLFVDEKRASSEEVIWIGRKARRFGVHLAVSYNYLGID